MSFLHAFQGLLSWLGWYILPMLAMLSLIVFIHELGHYWVGRWCGVKIEAFSLGFGPEIFARVDKRGTRWRLAAFPLGGYVKFLGDAGISSAENPEAVAALPAADRRQTLAGQPLPNRAAIVAAGPIANFLLAILLFAGVFFASGTVVHAPVVGSVVPGSAAERGGFKAGDIVKSIDGKPIASFNELHETIVLNTGIKMIFEVERAGESLTLQAAPELTAVETGIGKRQMGQLGLQSSEKPEDFRRVTCSPPECLVWGAQRTGFVAKASLAFFQGLFGGRESVDQVSGVIGVTQIVGAFAKFDPFQLFDLAAFFSVSVGLMNLLPVPLLDGGHLLYYACEALLGRPLSQRVQEIGLRVGIALIALLVIFTTSHDLWGLAMRAS